MHDTLTIGIPTFVILLGILLAAAMSRTCVHR